MLFRSFPCGRRFPLLFSLRPGPCAYRTPDHTAAPDAEMCIRDRTRSLRGSLPKLLWDGWVPLVTLLGRLYTENLYRWSSRILRIAVPFQAHPLDVISVAGYVLFKLHESVLKIPLTPYPYSRRCCTKLFSGFQKFQQFRQNCTLLVVQCHERNAELFGCFPFAAIFEEKHINELPLIL